MVFSSPIFLFLFLPLVLAYFLVPGLKLRNYWLLAFSILFYAWGEVVFVLLMLASTLMNYFLGRWVDSEVRPQRRKWAVGIAVALNIGTLVFFKYANFLVANANEFLGYLQLPALHMDPVRLPIGISFFTFHALSYVIDIYRRKSASAKNPCDVALYIFFFPQLIAGPILRWSSISPQIAARTASREKFAEGIRRFVGGFAKKMILANVLAVPADQIFALSSHELTAGVAWFGAACYTLQIYFDFSGYSDMAVGLGKMFGFDFMENFNYPYISQSITEFWRRWHISLSSWFRDYLYIPLGGNRCSTGRNYFNLVLVFLLCGLWHGASWTFALWGLYHGLFLVLERSAGGRGVERLPRPARHVYALGIVTIGLVIFRADSFLHACTVLQTMAGLATSTKAAQPLARFITHQVSWSFVLAILFSTPAWPSFKEALERLCQRIPEQAQPVAQSAGALLEVLLITALLLISASWLAGGTYNPFIYFRF